MRTVRSKPSLLAAAIAVFAMPGAAQAEYLIPPDNSAATQYTEAVPTAGGPKVSGKPRHGASRSPSKVLGSRNARQLESRGPAGRAAAAVAAETAPDTDTFAKGSSRATLDATSKQARDDSASKGGRGTGGDGSQGGTGNLAGRDAVLTSQQIPSGSSGLGEVIGQVTGSSASGQLGLLLPSIVLAVLAWSVAFVLRSRRRPTH